MMHLKRKWLSEAQDCQLPGMRHQTAAVCLGKLQQALQQPFVQVSRDLQSNSDFEDFKTFKKNLFEMTSNLKVKASASKQ